METLFVVCIAICLGIIIIFILKTGKDTLNNIENGDVQELQPSIPEQARSSRLHKIIAWLKVAILRMTKQARTTGFSFVLWFKKLATQQKFIVSGLILIAVLAVGAILRHYILEMRSLFQTPLIGPALPPIVQNHWLINPIMIAVGTLTLVGMFACCVVRWLILPILIKKQTKPAGEMKERDNQRLWKLGLGIKILPHCLYILPLLFVLLCCWVYWNEIQQWFRTQTNSLLQIKWLLYLAVCATGLIVIIYVFKKWNTKKQTVPETTATRQPTQLERPRRSLVPLLTIILILILLFILPLFYFTLLLQRPIYATVTNSLPQRIVNSSPLLGEWEYGWEKPPGVIGRDPTNRRETHRARIIRYDQDRFDIVVEIEGNGTEARMTWDKVESPEFGHWRQPAPADSGTWRLSPANDSAHPTFFQGWATHTNSERYNIWLVKK